MSFPKNQEEVESSISLESPQPCRKLTFSDIRLATQNFDESLVIGCGGFGKVYKATIPNGESHLVVAVKRLDSTSNQGAPEFWAEVKMLSNLRHCHLVSLIGYCDDGQEMILVYEYMSYGTLEDHLHKSKTFLPWVRRLTICIGAARGLDYLHTGTGIKHGVVHRDVKSSNILLHNSWEAKISDFGLSKICPKNQQSTYVKTMVKGTFGYLDPDYFYTGKLSRKSDVYAFGVVLFEALCGKRAVFDGSLDGERLGLALWAQGSIKEGRLKQIVDNHIKGEISPKCLKMFAQLAKRCLHKHLRRRPTMAEIVVGLESVLAIQEKANNMPGGITIFGRKAPVVLLPSNSKNSVSGNNLNSMELYFETIGHENQRLHQFDYETLSIATGNFSDQNKISQLASDSLYKGKLQNGQDIVIAGPSLGSRYKEHYMNEASILVKLEHENLAKLLGYCIEGTSLLLVYEFQLYTSFDSLLFDPACTLLNMDKRYKIILGVAKALLYLHKWRTKVGQLINYSTQNAWKDLKEDLPIVKWYKAVWFNSCNPRWAFTLWMAIKRKLLTQDRIRKWCPDTLLCPLCKSINDSHNHLFFNVFSMEVWKQLKKDIKMSNVPEIWDQIVLMMENMACTNSIWNVVNRLIIAATVYYIWKERNDRIFAQDPKSTEVVVLNIKEQLRLKIMSIKVRKTVHTEKVAELWNVKFQH